MPGASPPFALATPLLPFPALAQLAGRAPLGGGREVALACFVAARLVAGLLPPHALAADLRASRAAAARAWMAALSLPAHVRVPFARLVDASGHPGPVAALGALERVQQLVAEQLDRASRAELESLERALREIAAGDQGVAR